MARILSFLFLVFSWSTTIAQGDNNRLNGVILYQNSGKKPAVGVMIKPKVGSNGDESSETGRFTLEYAYKKAGDNAMLEKVGAKDGKGVHIELANPDAVRAISIPRDPKDSVVIIVCREGEMEENIEYYKKALAGYAQRYKESSDENRKLLQNLADTAEKRKLEKSIDSLENLYKNALERIDENAVYYASLNKDFLDEINRKALEYIEAGEIEKANKILDINEIDKQSDEGWLEKQSGENKIANSITSYKTKINVLKGLFNYKEAQVVSHKLIATYYKNQYPAYDIAKAYFELARIFLDREHYDSAIVYYTKTERIYDSLSHIKYDELGALYNNLGLSYAHNLQNAVATKYYKKALKVFRKHLGNGNPKVATVYNNIAAVYLSQKKWDRAITYFNEAYTVFLSHRTINLEALEKRGLDIKEQNTLKAEIGICYNNLGSAYRSKNEYMQAEEYYNKAIAIDNSINLKKYAKNLLATMFIMGADSTRYHLPIDSLLEDFRFGRLPMDDDFLELSYRSSAVDMFKVYFLWSRGVIPEHVIVRERKLIGSEDINWIFMWWLFRDYVITIPM